MESASSGNGYNSNSFKILLGFVKATGLKFIAIPFFAVLVALLDAFSIILIGPVLNLLELSLLGKSLNNKVISFVGEFAKHILSYSGVDYTPQNLILLLIAIIGIKSMVTLFSLILVAVLRGQLLLSVRKSFLSALREVNYNTFSKNTSGYYSSIVNDQSTRSLQCFYFFSQAVSFFILSLIYLGVAFLISWKFMALAVCLIACILTPFMLINLRLKKLSQKNAFYSSKMVSDLNQLLLGYKFLKSVNGSYTLFKKIFGHIKTVQKIQVHNGCYVALTQSLREPLGVLFLVAFFYNIKTLSASGAAEVFISILVIYRLFNASISFQTNAQLMFETIGSVELVNKEIETHQHDKESSGSESFIGFQKKLELKNISFKHRNSTNLIISDVNLCIGKNETVAIIGKSGTGKSSLCDLITRLQQPVGGCIYADGIDIKKFSLSSWRNDIGYVTQDNILFEGSIIENITMNFEIAETGSLQERVESVCKSLDIHKFIIEQEKGYDTQVGENGLKLSGGQKQRICLARELYRQPSILILDEATSSLDDVSAESIRRFIKNKKGSMTMIVITHNHSDLDGVDKVFRIENGTLCQLSKNYFS